MVARGKFKVNRICRLIGISKTTYYTAQNPADRFEAKYQRVKALVEKVIVSHPAYGIKRIKKDLEEVHDLKVGRDTLGKLLILWGLGLKRKVKANRPNLIQKILLALSGRANLLIRSRITAPFQAITSDLTELVFRGGKAYFCVHKDVLGQMVYGWSLELTMETNLILASLKMAAGRIKQLIGKRQINLNNPKPLIHQDRGSQYTSHQYVKAGLELGRLSYSDPGTPTHNPGQESFFGRFKDEWKEEIAELETFEELQKFVKAKIKYYNYERRHTSIGLVTPWEHTKLFLKNSR